MLAALLLATTPVYASGMDLSPIGGALGGVTESGMVALTANPAALAELSGAELAIDMGVTRWAMSTLVGDGPSSEGQGFMPGPYMAAGVPIGPISVGASFHIPYGGGGGLDENGGQRFHLIEGAAFLMEASNVLGWSPTENIHLGISGHIRHAATK